LLCGFIVPEINILHAFEDGQCLTFSGAGSGRSYDSAATTPTATSTATNDQYGGNDDQE
jgi:hypothetical protein